MAERVGVSRQAVLKWECNQSVPSTENLKIIAEYQSLVEARLIVIKNVNDHDIKERIDLLHNLNINLSNSLSSK